MTDLRKAAEMALEALERGTTGLAIRAIPALRQALAQPEQEPVRWFQQFGDAPPKREWVGLTLDDMPETYAGDKSFLNIAKWAEAKLKEKNGDARSKSQSEG